MSLLVLALIAFAAVHLVAAIPRAKAYWRGQLGRAYGPVYGLASLVLLVACVAAFRQAEVTQLYTPPSWGRHANFGLTFIAFLLLGIFLFRGTWRKRLRFPMALATAFWAAGHVLANGDGRSVVFFAGFVSVAFVHAFLSSRLQAPAPEDTRKGHNVLSLLFGIALYGVMAQLHVALVGVPVVDIAGYAR
jgi:uncharacterized membrane protein